MEISLLHKYIKNLVGALPCLCPEYRKHGLKVDVQGSVVRGDCGCYMLNTRLTTV
jgi:hypothetical protein